MAEELALEVARRVSLAGVEIVEVRISHLAYSPEIAQAMLQRQQANAVVAARSKIVDGAVGMVEMALHRLEADAIVELDEERKASMVSNLLVVLCSEGRRRRRSSMRAACTPDVGDGPSENPRRPSRSATRCCCGCDSAVHEALAKWAATSCAASTPRWR